MLDLALSVLRVASADGLSPDQVEDMVAKAALVKHSRGNRRYHDWVFDVRKEKESTVVVRMSRLHSPVKIVSKPGYPVLFEVCPDCDSDGCKECGWTGELEIVYQPK